MDTLATMDKPEVSISVSGFRDSYPCVLEGKIADFKSYLSRAEEVNMGFPKHVPHQIERWSPRVRLG